MTAHSTNYINYATFKSTAQSSNGKYYARYPPANTLQGQWWVFQNSNTTNTTPFNILFYASTGVVEQTFKVNNVSVTTSTITVGQTLQLWWNGTMMIGFKV